MEKRYSWGINVLMCMIRGHCLLLWKRCWGTVVIRVKKKHFSEKTCLCRMLLLLLTTREQRCTYIFQPSSHKTANNSTFIIPRQWSLFMSCIFSMLCQSWHVCYLMFLILILSVSRLITVSITMCQFIYIIWVSNYELHKPSHPVLPFKMCISMSVFTVYNVRHFDSCSVRNLPSPTE